MPSNQKLEKRQQNNINIDDENRDIIKILIASDIHLGYEETTKRGMKFYF
jgi:metallophosphoesterase superfamily enzyme